MDEKGGVALTVTHASQYAIVLDLKGHTLPFTDVNEGDWYSEAVEYVYRQDIMSGNSAETFGPNSVLTRAMVAQIFYNLEGKPEVANTEDFTDVSGHWAENAISWIQQSGVVASYEDGTFKPDRNISREELAQMIYNYAQYKGVILPALGDLSKYPDGGKVQDWAKTAMSWATGLKLINGYEDNTLRPGGNTTRAEAASIIMGLAQTLSE